MRTCKDLFWFVDFLFSTYSNIIEDMLKYVYVNILYIIYIYIHITQSSHLFWLGSIQEKERCQKLLEAGITLSCLDVQVSLGNVM